MKNDPAISETVSVILMIFMIVILAIAVTVLLFGANLFQQKSAYIAVDIQNISVSGTEVIRIFHRAGETASVNMNVSQQYLMSIYVDTTSGSYRLQPPSGVDTFSPGTTFFVYNTVAGLYNLTNNATDLAYAFPPTSLTSIRLIDENSHQLIAEWKKSTGGIPVSGLSVTGITPSSWWVGSTAVISSLDGSGFVSGSTPKLNRSGQSDIPALNITVISPTKITCNFSIPAGAATGPWNVVVTNPGGSSAMLANGFTLNPALLAPTVTGRSNATLYKGWPGYERITGTNFVSGARSVLNATTGTIIPSTSCTVRSATEMFCSYDLLGAVVSPPTYRVGVINPDGKSALMTANTVTISSPLPTVSTSSPATGAQAATVTINLSGTRFQPNAIVDYYFGGTRINLTNVNVKSPTLISGTLAIPSEAPTGSYGVSVTNTDGKTGVRTGRFSVTSNAPTLSARTPTSGNRGWPMVLTLTGSRFQPGATVSVMRGLDSITVTNLSVVSTTQITCTLDLREAYVPAGTTNTGSSTWNITVINPDSKSVTRTNWFTVYSYRPTISSISPNTAARGTPVSITNLAGTYFQPGATVQLRNATRVISTDTTPTVVSPAQITCQFIIPSSGVRPGTNAYYITVTNTDGRTRNSGNIFSIV